MSNLSRFHDIASKTHKAIREAQAENYWFACNLAEDCASIAQLLGLERVCTIVCKARDVLLHDNPSPAQHKFTLRALRLAHRLSVRAAQDYAAAIYAEEIPSWESFPTACH